MSPDHYLWDTFVQIKMKYGKIGPTILLAHISFSTEGCPRLQDMESILFTAIIPDLWGATYFLIYRISGESWFSGFTEVHFWLVSFKKKNLDIFDGEFLS